MEEPRSCGEMIGRRRRVFGGVAGVLSLGRGGREYAGGRALEWGSVGRKRADYRCSLSEVLVEVL